jgi:rhamnosyltransferase
MSTPIIDVIIPVYKPDKKLEQLLEKLVMQTVSPRQIILLNTECVPEYSTPRIKERVKTFFQKIKLKDAPVVDIRIVTIRKDEFDHGGTRAYGSTLSDAEFMIYMTQDAVPKDHDMIEYLLEPFHRPDVAIVYGKQEANIHANMVEQYTRLYNYPDKDCIKTREDKGTYGIKTYFCSNVCAAYRKEVYDELGGFVKRTIFNEDMIYAASAIEAGYSIAYASKARVIHSHSYTLMEQLRRNFDLGVSQREYKQVFAKISSEKEGMKFVKQTLSYFYDQKRYLEVFEFVMESGFKYIGYFLGKRYNLLPKSICQWLSMNKAYWN